MRISRARGTASEVGMESRTRSFFCVSFSCPARDAVAPRAMKKLGNTELRPRNHESVAHNAACFGYFSFFTGAGFLDLGFESCGFIPLAANEIEPNFAAVYRYSRNKMGIPLPRFGLQEESIANFL